MKKLSRPHKSQPAFNWDEDSPAKKAKLRMVELPTEDSVPLEKQFLFPREDLWVPVAVVNGNVHILPGVPRLCKSSQRIYVCIGQSLTTNSSHFSRGTAGWLEAASSTAPGRP